MKHFMVQYLLLISLLFAQDERIFRSILSGDFHSEIDKADVQTKAKWRANSPMYRLDLTHDGHREGIVYEVTENNCLLHIHDDRYQRIKSFSMDIIGPGAHVYRIVLKQLSHSLQALLIYFYEGQISYLDFEGRSRLYIMAIENNSLNNLEMYKGPYVFHEFKDKHTYINRFYHVYANDLDKDNIKEIVIKYRHSSYVLKYSYNEKGKGYWKLF